MGSDANQDLLSKKGGNGFPYMVFMDSEGDVIAHTDWPLSVDNFKKGGEKARSFLDLKLKAAAGDKGAMFEVLLAQLELAPIAPDEVEKRLKGIGELSKDQKAKLDPMLTNNEIKNVLSSVTNDPETQKAATTKILDLKKAGKMPTGDDEETVFGYWMLLLNHADHEADTPLFEEVLGVLKHRLQDNPRATKFLEEKEARLKELKGDGTSDDGKN